MCYPFPSASLFPARPNFRTETRNTAPLRLSRKKSWATPAETQSLRRDHLPGAGPPVGGRPFSFCRVQRGPAVAKPK